MTFPKPDHSTSDQRKADLLTFKQSLINSGRVNAIKALRALTGAGLKEAMDIVTHVFDAMDYVASNAVIANPECTRVHLDHAGAEPATFLVIKDNDVVNSFFGEFQSTEDAVNDAMDCAENVMREDETAPVFVARVVAKSKTITRRTLSIC